MNRKTERERFESQGNPWRPTLGKGVMSREIIEITSRGQWLSLRQRDVTASRIGALFDVHKYLTRAELACDLRGERANLVNSAMRRGTILEPAVAAAVAEEYPDWQITKPNTYHRIPDARLGATPDFFVGETGLLQCKTTSPQEWESWRGRVPLFYTLQCLTEMLVCEKTEGWLAVLVAAGSFPLHVFPVERHPAAEAKILSAVAEWWRAWDAGEIAGAAPSDEIAADVDDGSHRDLTGDNLLPKLLPERARLKGEISVAEARVKEIDHEIKQRVGSARTAWLPGWMISLPTISRKAYSVAAGTYRRLDVKESEHE